MLASAMHSRLELSVELSAARGGLGVDSGRPACGVLRRLELPELRGQRLCQQAGLLQMPDPSARRRRWRWWRRWWRWRWRRWWRW